MERITNPHKAFECTKRISCGGGVKFPPRSCSCKDNAISRADPGFSNRGGAKDYHYDIVCSGFIRSSKSQVLQPRSKTRGLRALEALGSFRIRIRI